MQACSLCIGRVHEAQLPSTHLWNNGIIWVEYPDWGECVASFIICLHWPWIRSINKLYFAPFLLSHTDAYGPQIMTRVNYKIVTHLSETKLLANGPPSCDVATGRLLLASGFN